MIKLQKKLPQLIIAAVILPGLIISSLGIVLVSQQKNTRLERVRTEYTKRLTQIRNTIENDSLQLAERVFRQLQESAVDYNRGEAILKEIKKIVQNNPVVKYPFLINSENNYLFPLPGKTRTATETSTNADAGNAILNKKSKALYLKGYLHEYRERNLIEAIKTYRKGLKKSTREKVKRIFYNAIGRSYVKLNRYPQAIDNYFKIIRLNREQEAVFSEKEPSLYFTALRQTAVSYNGMDEAEKAIQYYLLLYEKIQGYEAGNKNGTFAFYKNEALDYLNNHIPIGRGGKQNRRFRCPEIREQLEKVSTLDISLEWMYFDTTQEEQRRKDFKDEEAFKFLRLRELYEATDEKTRFYKQLKKNSNWEMESTQPAHIAIRQLKIPGTRHKATIAFKRVMKATAPEPLYFGFILSPRYIKAKRIPQLGARELDDSRLYLEVTATGKNGLMSVPFRTLWPGNRLVLDTAKPDYFQTVVRGEIRLYYLLLAALIITLVMSTLLFYKYLSRENELVKMKAEFVDNASHTLKTPLTRIALLAENVQQGWVTDENKKKEYFETIISETAGMTQMIDNMLNYSRIEADKQQYEPRKNHLQELTETMIDQYTGYLKETGIQLKVEIDQQLPAIKVDPKAIQTIFVNLLQNAIKYSPKEKVIAIRVFKEAKSGVLEIEDKGMGIPKKEISHIFKKFSRVTDHRIKAIEGSGLGLYLVRHAVDAHNGQIRVESAVAKGTKITVSFPIEQKKQKKTTDSRDEKKIKKNTDNTDNTDNTEDRETVERKKTVSRHTKK
ncbi:MAG: HAMP domain-containing histidine kinase [bacterium]|nr:HAMP domain-containing histidine kinase [bacterium]